MRVHKGIFAALPGVLLLAGASGIRAGQTPETPWRTDWEKARAEARRVGKPLFVVFR